MYLLLKLKSFFANDDGAITVDWVVLTAALVGLGLAVMGLISGGIEELSNDINATMEGVEIDDEF